MGEKLKFINVDVLDQNGNPCAIVLQEYKNLEIVSSFDREGNHYSSYATPKTPTPILTLARHVKLFINQNSEINGIKSVNLVIADKVLPVDKKTDIQFLQYEFNHYDEIYGTALEHLK